MLLWSRRIVTQPSSYCGLGLQGSNRCFGYGICLCVHRPGLPALWSMVLTPSQPTMPTILVICPRQRTAGATTQRMVIGKIKGVIDMKRVNIRFLGALFSFAALVSVTPSLAHAQGAEGENVAVENSLHLDHVQTVNQGTEKATEGNSRIRIGPGDLLDLKVFDVPELDQVVRVNDYGDASFSLIGGLHVAGLTVDEARLLIASKLREGNYILNPQVAVLIREYNSQGVSVIGEVKRPGVYGVLGRQSLLDVIAAAGGATPLAGASATVKRSSDGSTLTVHLTRDAQESLASDVRLYPGDKVIIPRAGLVYVLGDVGRPGGFIMENDGKLTLLEALAMAGGNNRTASLSHSKLIRKTGTGYAEVPIRLTKIIQGEDPAPPLEAQDILYIPSNAMKSFLSRTVPSIVSSAVGAAVYHGMP